MCQRVHLVEVKPVGHRPPEKQKYTVKKYIRENYDRMKERAVTFKTGIHGQEHVGSLPSHPSPCGNF